MNTDFAPPSLESSFQLPTLRGRQAGENAIEADQLEHLLVPHLLDDAVETDLLDDAVEADLLDDLLQAQVLDGRPQVDFQFLSGRSCHGFDLLPHRRMQARQ